MTTITTTSLTAGTHWGPTGSPADTEYLVQPSSGATLTIAAGATLVIDPGTTVRVAPSVSLVVNGTLTANGASGQPIRFESNGAGLEWAGMTFDIGATASVTQCIFSGFATYPVTAHSAVAGPLFANNTFVPRSDERWNAIRLRGGTSTSNRFLTRPPAKFCYFVYPGDDLVIEAAAGPVYTIEAGTVIKLSSGSYIMCGDGAAGALRAKGVVFTSALDDTVGDTNGDGVATTPSPGNWQAIYFRASTIDAQAMLDSCVVRYAGGGSNGGISITSADPTITRSVIEQNNGFGLRVEPGNTAAAAISGNLFRDNTTYELVGTPSALANLVPNNTVMPSADGRHNSFEVRGVTLTASVALSRPPAGFCYHLTPGEQVVVEGAANPVLTIADRTVVKFASGSYLMCGNAAAGALRAKGVVFTSVLDDTLGDTNGDGSATPPGPGNWQGLYFRASTIDAQARLDSCVVRYAGGGSNGGISITSADPTISRCVIEQNTGFGLRVEPGNTAAAAISGNLFRDNTTYELVGTPSALANLVPNNTVMPSTDGRHNSFEVRGVTLTASVTLPTPPAGFCYHLTPGEQVVVEGAANPVLTIADRTVVKFASGSYLMCGNAAAGALRARGAVFTSASDDTVGDTNGDGSATTPGPGNWQGLYFRASTVDAQALLDSCVVRYAGGGSNSGISITSADPGITRSVIEHNTGYGISIEAGTTTGSGIVGNLVRENAGFELRAPLAAAAAVLSSNDVAPDPGAPRNGVEIVAATVNGSVTLPKLQGFMCYYLNGNMTIGSGATLTIPAGVVIKMGASDVLTVSGTLIANGSIAAPPYEPVVFTSVADDVWWGDTDGDGLATPATPGSWGRIEINTASNASRLRGVTFRHGGSGTLGQLRLLNTGSQPSPNVLIEDCFFDVELASGGGIHVTNANPRIVRCGFRGTNARFGVQNLTAGLEVDATGNWWGDPSGPEDSSPASLAGLDPAGDEGVLACTGDANAGFGVRVTDCVRYRPFLEAPLDAPVTGIEEPAPGVTSARFLGIYPNPARSLVRFGLAILAGAPGRLEILDIAGRRVRAFELEAPTSGLRTIIQWDLTTSAGVRVAPGLYLARFHQGGTLRTRAVIVAP